MKSILRTAAAGVALASFGIASSASAATTSSADVTAQILTSLSVAVDVSDNTLNFGTVADGGIAGPTNVTVSPAGARTLCGTKLVCAGTINAPTFNVTGLGNAVVNLSFVNATETLSFQGTAPGGMASTLTASAFTTSAASNRVTLSAGGTGSFTVGGTLAVDTNQAPGTYAGTLSVSVAYN